MIANTKSYNVKDLEHFESFGIHELIKQDSLIYQLQNS